MSLIYSDGRDEISDQMLHELMNKCKRVRSLVLHSFCPAQQFTAGLFMRIYIVGAGVRTERCINTGSNPLHLPTVCSDACTYKGLICRLATERLFRKRDIRADPCSVLAGSSEVKVDMTAPVTCRVEPGDGPACESRFTVSFYVPREHQASPPEPSDPEVFVEQRKEFTAYVR